MVAYISGPMDGYPNHNKDAFYAAERVLRRQGWEVINPARLDEEHPVPPGMTRAQERRFFMERDLNAIINGMLAELGDTIFFLRGSCDSSGAQAELALGRSLGMNIRPFREERK